MTILTALQLLDRLGTNDPMLDGTGDVEPVTPTRTHRDAPSRCMQPDVVYVTSTHALHEHLHRLAGASALGMHLQTTGPDPHTDVVRQVTVANDDVALVINAPGCRGWAEALAPVLADVSTTKVLHDAAFALAFLVQNGTEVRGLHDTMLAAQLIDGGSNLHAPGYFTLAALAARELGVMLDDRLHVADGLDEHPTPGQIRSTARNAAMTLALSYRQVESLTAERLVEVAALEFAAVPAVAWLHHSGAPFDLERWAGLSDRAVAAQLRLTSEIQALIGRSVNLDSPVQLRAALAELGIEMEVTGHEILIEAVDQHSVVGKILEYREASQRARTYGLAFVGHVNGATGRIHPSYRQIGAATGRMSCRTPNLVGSSRVDLQACKLEYSIVSPK